MARRRRQTVWLGSERIGEVTSHSRSAIAFEYDEEILQRMPFNVPLLSCSLPVMPGRCDARAFMGGLLPEGDHLRMLAQLARCLPDDVFALLDAFGQDIAGAAVIGEEVARRPEAVAVPYTATTLADEVAGLTDRPLALYEDSELSIAGLQNKMLLVALPDGGWARPVRGFPSTHILKLDDRAHPGLVHAEHMCLEIAKAAGIPAAESHIVEFAGVEAIIVKRFDRVSTDDDRPVRVHQEDVCQALGVNVESARGQAKYESHGGPSLRQVAGLLAAWAVDSEAELARLLEQVVFTVAIANAAAHGKNVSFFHRVPEHISLCPMYDTVPTGLWPSLRSRAAMSVGAVVDVPAITGVDMVNEAGRWGLRERLGKALVMDCLDRIVAASHDMVNVGELPTAQFVNANARKLAASV